MPEAATWVVPSLINLPHTELTVCTPWPVHRLIWCVLSNITYVFEISLVQDWKVSVELWILLAPQCWTEGVIIISPSLGTHCCLLCCEVRVEKSAHIYVGAYWMVGHSTRGKKTTSDSEETHPSTMYTVWCSDSQKTHPMCSIFGAFHKKHILVRVLLFASEMHLKSSS
jgi:hypothetical protein